MTTERKEANGAAPQPTIDQVRELLFGAEQRTIEAQLLDMRAEMYQIRAEMEQKIKLLQSELSAALSQSDQNNKDRLNKIGEAIEQVGRDISDLSG